MDFQQTTQTAAFYNPLEDFDHTEISLEIREDPLTGRQARIVPESFLLPEEEPDIDAVVSDSEGCFFCPELVNDATPKYPDWVGDDRGHRGEATSFPNLNPYGAYSNVVALTEDHFRPLDAFTPRIFRDGIAAALEYIHAVFDHDETANTASINMNFLRPAGSSIIHPHLQTLVDDRGTTALRTRFAAAREYYDAENQVYWDDLLAEERDTARFVGTTGAVEWLAPFAPKHHFHLLGILTTDGLAPDDRAVGDLAAGITNGLAYYSHLGLNSFNFAIHLVRDDPAIRPVIDLVGRSVFDEYYWSDSPFFPTLHDEAVVDVPPGEYAGDARTFYP